MDVPRDPSSAAFALVAALIVPGSEIALPAVLLNPRRIGLIETLLEMGANIDIENERDSGGEEIGDLIVRAFRAQGRRGAAGARAVDDRRISDPGRRRRLRRRHAPSCAGLEELRVKESDRLAADRARA